jgi:hypothetical protein
MPVKYRIHPAIGIGRLGDSLDDFFIGPEAPGISPALNKPDESSNRPGKYKDEQGRIKRQGARFRIYEYTEDAAGAVTRVREITAADAEIEWEVHLANRKAAALKLKGKHDKDRRNAKVKNANRHDLIIDAGPQRISGANQAMKPLRGKFMKSLDVQLGDLLTDARSPPEFLEPAVSRFLKHAISMGSPSSYAGYLSIARCNPIERTFMKLPTMEAQNPDLFSSVVCLKVGGMKSSPSSKYNSTSALIRRSRN